MRDQSKEYKDASIALFMLKKDVTEILSNRELEVLEYIGKGMTTKEIADTTFLGIKTVETYKSKIKEKLDLKNSNQLIKFAVEWLMQMKK